MRGHPASYSGGTALQNVIPQGFRNTETLCATHTHKSVKQCSDVRGLFINKSEILLSEAFIALILAVITDTTQLVTQLALQWVQETFITSYSL